MADKLPLTLDRQGVGQISLKDLPADARPRQLQLEASYADPNGEVQTLRGSATLWPAAVIAGLKTEGWVSLGGAGRQSIRFQALALDLAGHPQAGVALDVTARLRVTTSSRKRMVGGFYSYDNKTELKDLGTVCSGRSDARGLLLCDADIREAGEVELVASAKDAEGRVSQAASSVWLTRQGELWFGGSDSDRIDLLPEKKELPAGRDGALPGPHALPLCHRLGRGGARGHHRDASAAAGRSGPDDQPEGAAALGPERLRQRAGAARPAARGALVQLLHLGLQGTARMVDGLLGRRA